MLLVVMLAQLIQAIMSRRAPQRCLCRCKYLRRSKVHFHHHLEQKGLIVITIVFLKHVNKYRKMLHITTDVYVLNITKVNVTKVLSIKFSILQDSDIFCRVKYKDFSVYYFYKNQCFL